MTQDYPSSLSADELDLLEATARTVLAGQAILVETGAQDTLDQEAQVAFTWLRLIGMIREAKP